MEAQTAIAGTAGRNYVQLRVKGEPDPFFFCINEGLSTPGVLAGDIVDKTGKCLKRNEQIPRRSVSKVTRAILTEGLFPSLIPVNPISPASGKRG